MSAQDTIRETVTSHPVVLYMKGSPDFPQCGFSAQAVQALRANGVNTFHSVNIFEDPELREALTDGSADGMGSIRAIVAGAAAHLEKGGWLLFEHGYDQARPVRALLEAAGFASIVSLPDLAGIPRVAGGKIG